MVDPVPLNPLPDARPRPGRQALIWILKILVSGGLLYVLLRPEPTPFLRPQPFDVMRLWHTAKMASVPWLATALLLYFVQLLIASWRWWLLVRAQRLSVGYGYLLTSYLVATFFSNFMPSNIGGDVIRIRDTVKPAGSKTLATMIVLVDRGIGMMGLIFVAALGSTAAAQVSDAIGPVGPGLLWGALAVGLAIAAPAVFMPQTVRVVLNPLKALHQEWVEERIARLTDALGRFRDEPKSLGGCFIGAILVQGTLVIFYAAIARALHIPVPLAHLAIMVPISFIVQMAPVSVNGFGVREATFSFYFSRLGLPVESALALSFIGAALMLIFSASGAVANLTRGK